MGFLMHKGTVFLQLIFFNTKGWNRRHLHLSLNCATSLWCIPQCLCWISSSAHDCTETWRNKRSCLVDNIYFSLELLLPVEQFMYTYFWRILYPFENASWRKWLHTLLIIMSVVSSNIPTVQLFHWLGLIKVSKLSIFLWLPVEWNK
jgi:hypothetical protein